MANSIRLTSDEAIAVFYRYHHLLRPRRRAVFELVEIFDRSHEEVVARKLMPTVKASRTELTRARDDLDRIAEMNGEIDGILIARELAALPVHVREHSRRNFED